MPTSWPGRPPDFVGVGAERSGTTWWYGLLCAHPDSVADPDNKERHFFDRFWGQDFGETAIVEYHACFAADPAKRVGEWTPRYLYDPWVPPLLRAAAPETRVLVLLRDPLARFRSGVTHRFYKKPFLPASLMARDAFSRGRYGEQLAHLYRSFDPDQVLVLQYEQCVANPVDQLKRTYDFCGLATGVVPADIVQRKQATPREQLNATAAAQQSLADAYADDLRLLVRLAPNLDLRLWPTAVRLGIA